MKLFSKENCGNNEDPGEMLQNVLQLHRMNSPRKFVEGFNRDKRNEKFSAMLKKQH